MLLTIILLLLTSTVTIITADILALHQLVKVATAGDTVIRLKAYDVNSENLVFKITTLPTSGQLYQLSQVYSTKGYLPIAGTLITQPGVIVTGSSNRVYYKRPSPDASGVNKWDSFNYTVSGKFETSFEGTVTLVPSTGALVGSTFLLDNEAWNIVGNKAISSSSTFEPYSRGPNLNRYIYSTDDKINILKAGSNSPDQSLWYFSAPSKFLGNQGISYGGILQFTLSGFSGDFSTSNGNNVPAVILECASCDGPVSKGIRLAMPLSALPSFTGSTSTFKVQLLETKGWVKDPQNTLLSWSRPSQCDMIQVLSRLSSIRILGDWTTWYETVALDEVLLYNLQGQIPVCAMYRPDASVCLCH